MAQQPATNVKVQDSSAISRYFRGVKHEFKKIVWPTRDELVNYTGVVLFISILIAIVVYLLDLAVHFGFSFILG